MSKITAQFKMVRQTTGALKYDEVDESGRPLEMRESSIGTIYLRKTNFPDGNYPSDITVTVE